MVATKVFSCPDASFSALPASLPEFFARKSGALRQGGKLCPGDLVVDASAEAAISPRNDVFAANYLRKADNSFGHQFGRLDEVSRVTDHARNQKLAVR